MTNDIEVAVEIAVTEHALGLLLSEIKDPYILESPSGRLHKCSVCQQESTWGPDWYWFGSFLDEDWANVRKSCSRACWEQMTKDICRETETKLARRRNAATARREVRARVAGCHL